MNSRNNQVDIVISEQELQNFDFPTNSTRDSLPPSKSPQAHMVLVHAKCSRSAQDYFVIFEQVGTNSWAIRSTLKSTNSSDMDAIVGTVQQGLVSGKIDWSDLWNGKATCPHCASVAVASCGKCRQLSCHPNGQPGSSFHCPTCGSTGNLRGEIKSLDGAGGKGKK